MTFNTSTPSSYANRILKLMKNDIGLAQLRSYLGWAEKQFGAPSPDFIKRACLIRNSYQDATWVETGTYMGRTTEVLAGHGSKVYSIEPEPTLFANAKKYLRNFEHVELINGTSEKIFPSLLPKIHGSVNFWLDGHYSAGLTFKGPQDTPILDELKHIAENMSHFKNMCVLVDDVRCFNPQLPEYSTYPTLDVLVDWARQHKLFWHIEHDIFVARTSSI